jgi:3,4-dihydroxy 2-butanone 4-phosphate synthase/GTP cyclohydrolase II
VHLKDTLRDVIGVRAPELGWPLRGAMRRIAAEENGVVVILRGTESPRDLVDAAQSLGTDRSRGTPSAPVLRTYGIGAQILQDLGVSRMRVLSAPKQMLGLSAFGLEVTEYVDEASGQATAGAPDAA